MRYTLNMGGYYDPPEDITDSKQYADTCDALDILVADKRIAFPIGEQDDCAAAEKIALTLVRLYDARQKVNALDLIVWINESELWELDYCAIADHWIASNTPPVAQPLPQYEDAELPF